MQKAQSSLFGAIHIKKDMGHDHECDKGWLA
jgi:hypothetical protein